MCAVSFVSDYYNREWIQRFPTYPVQDFPPDVKKDLLEVLKRLDSIDKRLGDIECMDKEKEEFLKKLSSKKPKRS